MSNYTLRTVVTIVVSFLVSMINFMLKIVFRNLAKFEKYKSLTHEIESIFKKLFVAIFINMAILLLLINANFQSINFVESISDWLPIGGELFFNGKYDDLNRQWYQRVGLAFLILVISTVFSNLISSAFWELFRMYKRTIKAKKQLLQADMNLNMLGGYFEIDAKYSMTCAMIFMCHLYFGALPMLLPLITIYFFVQFWLDKLYLTKFAKKPPHYHANIHIAMIRLLPWAPIVHCAFSLWAYSNPEIWPDNHETKVEDGESRYYAESRSFGERVLNENALPFLILMIILVCVYFIEIFIEGYIFKYFLRSDSTVDLKQQTFRKNEEKMSKFSETSYNPMHNESYAKILLAMQDVAIVKKDVSFSDSNSFIFMCLVEANNGKDTKKNKSAKEQQMYVTYNSYVLLDSINLRKKPIEL